MTDKIADMLIRIKNAGLAEHDTTQVPYSDLKHAVARTLLKAGYITSVEKKGKKVKKTLEIGIAYGKDGKPKMKEAKRVSKLSCRVYYGYRDIRPVRNGFGCLILSTPKGILTGDAARKEQVGGEPLFKVW